MMGHASLLTQSKESVSCKGNKQYRASGRRTLPEWIPVLCERRYNRQTHKLKILKGGKRKRNQAEYLVKGFRLFDRVAYEGKPYFIFGRRASGYFDIRNLSGEKVNKGSISYKKLQFLGTPGGYLTEIRTQDGVEDAIPPIT